MCIGLLRELMITDIYVDNNTRLVWSGALFQKLMYNQKRTFHSNQYKLARQYLEDIKTICELKPSQYGPDMHDITTMFYMKHVLVMISQFVVACNKEISVGSTEFDSFVGMSGVFKTYQPTEGRTLNAFTKLIQTIDICIEVLQLMPNERIRLSNILSLWVHEVISSTLHTTGKSSRAAVYASPLSKVCLRS